MFSTYQKVPIENWEWRFVIDKIRHFHCEQELFYQTVEPAPLGRVKTKTRSERNKHQQIETKAARDKAWNQWKKGWASGLNLAAANQCAKPNGSSRPEMVRKKPTWGRNRAKIWWAQVPTGRSILHQATYLLPALTAWKQKEYPRKSMVALKVLETTLACDRSKDYWRNRQNRSRRAHPHCRVQSSIQVGARRPRAVTERKVPQSKWNRYVHFNCWIWSSPFQ